MTNEKHFRVKGFKQVNVEKLNSPDQRVFLEDQQNLIHRTRRNIQTKNNGSKRSQRSTLSSKYGNEGARGFCGNPGLSGQFGAPVRKGKDGHPGKVRIHIKQESATNLTYLNPPESSSNVLILYTITTGILIRSQF